jgi:hypothetical protein
MIALLFAATSTPLPVVVRSMVPEVVKSLPPVQVSNFPSDAVAWWTLYAAIAAAVVALLTLAAVGWQIWLAAEALRQAQKELVAAETQLKVTEQSNALVLEELEYSRTQAQDVRRKAKLSLWNNRHRIGAYYLVVTSEEQVEEITVNLWLYNEGERTARDATIFLWLPWPEWKVPDWNGISNPVEPFAEQGFRVIANVPLNNRRYWNVAVDVPFPTYPRVERLALTFKMQVPVPFDGSVLWRVGYDDGIEPPPGEPERLLNFHIFRRGEGENNPDSQI